jgi:Cytochrome c554 and c-prime
MPSIWRALFAAGVAGLLLGCSKPAPKPHELTIQFTADVDGRLVPCGCFTGQLGGLTRIATLFGPAGEHDILRLDAGDAIEGPADYQRIEHRYLIRAFAEMGYAALNIGHREAQLSADQLRELRSRAGVPFVSANLLDATTHQPIFESYRIINRGKWRIAIVGVLDPRGTSETLGSGLVVERMETVLGSLLPQLKSQADFIVLLAFTDEAAMHALAREFYELDVILGGNVSQPAQHVEHENRSIIFYVTNESRAVGSLPLKLHAPHKVEMHDAEVKLVSDRIPEATSIRQLAIEYRDEIRRTKLDIDDPQRLGAELVPGVKNAASYIGSETCVECHANAGQTWQKSAHAHAFKTLLHLKADADPNCIPCHTVGFQTPSGYRREFGASKLVNVGCESCHGPGGLHVEQRRSGAPPADNFRTLGAGDCQKCHHGEFSRPFEWEKFWPAIQHGR